MFSGGRSTPSGHAGGSKSSWSPLASVQGEIDAVTSEIRSEKAKWERANAEDKAFYQKSIDMLNSRLERLMTTRDKLIDARFAVPVPALGKSTQCSRRPPLYVCIGG